MHRTNFAGTLVWAELPCLSGAEASIRGWALRFPQTPQVFFDLRFGFFARADSQSVRHWSPQALRRQPCEPKGLVQMVPGAAPVEEIYARRACQLRDRAV